MMNNQYPAIMNTRRRRSATVLVSIAIVASLCLQGLMSDNNNDVDSHATLDSHNTWDIAGDDGDDPEDMDDELSTSSFRRFLRSSAPKNFPQGGYVTEDDYDAAFALAASEPTSSSSSSPLQPYTLEDTITASKLFSYTFCILIYDPPSDKFIGMYSQDHKWKNGNRKLWHSMRNLAFILRKTFPERFTPQSEEFVMAMGSGDYPHVRSNRLPYVGGVAPVLMFGSSFRDPTMFENMMAMPMPTTHHLTCMVEWVEQGRVCKAYRPATMDAVNGEDTREGKMVFGEEYGLEWDDLIPQLVWRGTDFSYLPTLGTRPSLIHIDSRNIVPSPTSKGDRRVTAIHALNKAYDTLLPRWKAMVLSANAELEVGEKDKLPWADMKFSSYLSAGKSSTVGSARYADWESVGIATGKGMPPSGLAEYKYHIDLGGGGGTTWSGTVEKLAFPGLLFHHVTPTKDYIHDRLAPWRHYVPVSSDLKDLKAKFDWAESHPRQAKQIGDAATEFMRDLGTPEGFGRMVQEDLVEPLRRVIEAYQPVRSVHPKMKSWKELLQSMGSDARIMPVYECSGLTPEQSCGLVGGDVTLAWQRGGVYTG